jgi:hypothetical protein
MFFAADSSTRLFTIALPIFAAISSDPAMRTEFRLRDAGFKA